MQKDYTDITILLDRSGSMGRIKNDMVCGIESFIEEQKKLPGKCTLTLVQFDSHAYENVFVGKSIKDTPPINMHPGGSTPLLDSVARCIKEAGERLKAMDVTERPEFVIMMIVTDGEENASREFTREAIKKLVTHQTDIYKWHFTYLGADQDAFSEASMLGIPQSAALNYKANPIGTRSMFDSANLAMSSLRTRQSDIMAYQQSDIDKQNKA